MVDVGIKKIKINKSEFPLVQFTTIRNEALSRDEVDFLHYDFRYRVVSEDKNRFSHWSEIIRYPMPDVTTPFPFTENTRITVSKSGNPETVNAVWSFPGDAENPSDYVKFFRDTTQYDIWIRWNSTNNAIDTTTGWTNWQSIGTFSSNVFSILKPNPDYKTVEIAIQIPTSQKIRDYNNNKLTLFRKFGAV
jgi:hypothetical protein